MIYIWKKYDCPYPYAQDTNYKYNCSAEYLTNAQWGRSEITLNPPYNNSEEYFPTGTTNETLSVVTWGVPGIEKEPEYYFYSQFHNTSFNGTERTPPLDAW